MDTPRRILAVVAGAAAIAVVAPAAVGHQEHHAAEGSRVEADVAVTKSLDVVETPLPLESAETTPADEVTDAAPGAERPAGALLGLLGRLHPMSTHFPIASFMLAAIAEALLAATRAMVFRHSVRFLVWSGAIGALGAAPLGWAFASTTVTDTSWLIDSHRWAGTSAALAAPLVLWLCERAERVPNDRSLFRIALAAQALLIGVTGYLGGSLLYGIDHLWPVG